MMRANFHRNIYPERLDYIDQVLTFANQKVAEYQNSADLHSQATQSQILSLLLSPIKTYISLFTALALPNFIPLLHSQPYPTRRAVAGEVARSLMRNQTNIASVGNLESVLEILKVLIREGIQQAQGYPGGPIQRRAQETEETIEEQGWLARIVHLIRAEDNDTQFKVGGMIFDTCMYTNILLAPPSCAQGLCRRQRARQVHFARHHHSITQTRAAV